MGKKGKNRPGDNYESLSSDHKSANFKALKCIARCTTRYCRPLRIFQFFSTLLLFAMVVYLTAMPFHHLTHLASILLIILTSTYLFFMAVDMISQFEGHGLPDSPMFLFSLLGTLLYAIAGSLLIHYRSQQNDFWALILARVLSFVISVLFFLEVTMLLTYWRQTCLTWNKCYPYTPAGDCGQRELKTIFSHNERPDVDPELGHRDLTTSISHCGVPIDTAMDIAVVQHGCRKISVAHRRQYVDCQSSVPALSNVQMAQIQTENETTVFNACQTQRTETRESIVQTTSRCELCHRQMDDTPLSPTKLTTPTPSPEPQSRYSSFQYNAPQSTITPEPQPQRGHCAICPAYFQMMPGAMSAGMQGGMPSPCCQSCNCGATEQSARPIPYLLDQASQRLDAEMPSSHWSQQRETPTRPATSASLRQTGSESPTTTNEKSDVERGDLAVQEANRYRPIKKISRVYETRPCPTHGSGLAARMAGLPETITKVTLSSICMRRNKRTQTPTKKHDSSISEDPEKSEAKEETIDERKTEDKSEYNNDRDQENVDIESIGNYHEKSRSSGKIDKLSEDRLEIVNESNIRNKIPKKLYRDSETIVRSIESILSKPIDDITDPELDVSCGSSPQEVSTGRMLWKSVKSEIRESDNVGIVDSWLGEKSRIKQEPDDATDPERSADRLRYEKSIVKDESLIPVKSRDKSMEESIVTMDRQESKIGSAPVLRLRLKKSVENSSPTVDGSRDMNSRSTNLESRSILESVSKGRSSSVDSDNSSRAKDGSITDERSSKFERETSEYYTDLPDDDERSLEGKMSAISEGKEKSSDEITERDNESEIEVQKSSSIRPMESSASRERTKSVLQDEERSKSALSGIQSGVSKIVPSSETKSLGSQERSVKIERDSLQYNSQILGTKKSHDEETSDVSEGEEKQQYEIAEAEEIVKKSSSSVPKEFEASRRVSRTKSTSKNDESRKTTTSRSQGSASKIMRSPSSKKSVSSPERSIEIGRDSSKNNSHLLKAKSSFNEEASEISEDEEKQQYEMGEAEEIVKKSSSSVPKEFETSRRTTRNKSISQKDDNSITAMTRGSVSKIIRSPSSRKSVSSSERSIKIGRDSSKNDSNLLKAQSSFNEETSEISEDEEKQQYEMAETEEIVKKSSSSVPKEFETSRRTTRNKSISQKDDNSKTAMTGGSVSKIIRSPSSRKSVSSSERSTKIGRDSSKYDSNLLKAKSSFNEEASEISEEEEKQQYEMAETEEIVKKSSSSVPKEFETSRRTTRTKSIPQKDDNSKTAMTGGSVSKIIRSSSSKKRLRSPERSAKIEREISKKHSDQPDINEISLDEETPERFRSEEKQYEIDEPEEIVKKSLSTLPKEFARSSRISRTKPSMERPIDDMKNVREENIEEDPDGSKKKSVEKGSREIVRGKSSLMEKLRSRRETSVTQRPQSETRRKESSQRSSRSDPIDRRENTSGVCYPGMVPGGSERPMGRCMEISDCQRPPRCSEEYDCAHSVCTDDTICIEPCSCRVKSILESQNRQCAHYNMPEQSSNELQHLVCESEMRGQCPGIYVPCARAQLTRVCNMQQPDNFTPRPPQCCSQNPPSRSHNFCYLS